MITAELNCQKCEHKWEQEFPWGKDVKCPACGAINLTDMSDDDSLEAWTTGIKEPPKLITRAEREARRPMRGLGDVVAAMTKAVGIKPCGGCRERQKRLNQLFPLGVDKPDLSK